MWPRQTIGVVTVLGLTAMLQWSCTGSTPRDQNFGQEAGRDFEAPIEGTGGASADDGSAAVGGAPGIGGDTGQGGSTDDASTGQNDADAADADIDADEVGDASDPGAPGTGTALAVAVADMVIPGGRVQKGPLRG
jgi:hypothetical protein